MSSRVDTDPAVTQTAVGGQALAYDREICKGECRDTEGNCILKELNAHPNMPGLIAWRESHFNTQLTMPLLRSGLEAVSETKGVKADALVKLSRDLLVALQYLGMKKVCTNMSNQQIFSCSASLWRRYSVTLDSLDMFHQSLKATTDVCQVIFARCGIVRQKCSSRKLVIISKRRMVHWNYHSGIRSWKSAI